MCIRDRIYSAPTGFDESESQAYTSGTRIDMRDRTIHHDISISKRIVSVESLQNLNVATSEAVVRNGAPALGQGIFAITSFPSSIVRRKALLEFPSILTTRTHFVLGPNIAAAREHSMSMLNSTKRWSSWCFSLINHRPEVYLNSSSRPCVFNSVILSGYSPIQRIW